MKRIEEMDEAASISKSSVAKREPSTLDLIQHKNVTMSLLCMTVYLSAMTFQSTIMNPMLTTIYDLPPSKSSLVFTISALAFVLGAPLTHFLRKRKIVSRRTIIYVGLFLMGFAMIVRTGDIFGQARIGWVYSS